MSQRHVVVAPVGDNINALYIGLREFPTRKIILVAHQRYLKDVADIQKELERFYIPVDVVEMKGDVFEGMFQVFALLCNAEPQDDLLVNVATGDKLSSCAALSAAYVNGLKAFTVIDNEPMLLPVLKFSYYRLVSGRKVELLRHLSEGPYTLSRLAEQAKMSLPLLVYHVYGDRESPGLVQLRLAETLEEGKEKKVSLTSLGRLFVKGFIPQPSPQEVRRGGTPSSTR